MADGRGHTCTGQHSPPQQAGLRSSESPLPLSADAFLGGVMQLHVSVLGIFILKSDFLVRAMFSFLFRE